MTLADQSGPLTAAQLLAIWKGAVDVSYSRPIIAAGEGHGLEAITQMTTQLSRVSSAIDRSTEALFILPWSGQTSESATGAQSATVQIAFSRSLRFAQPLVFAAGSTFVEEQIIEAMPDGGVPTLTGRRYFLAEPLALPPGVQGPIAVTAIAERAGFGYSNPLANAIQVIDQVGGHFNNVGASVSVFVAPTSPNPAQQNGSIVVCAADPDVFLPQHVGSYVELTAGSNTGFVGRVVAYFPPPDPSLTGGSVLLADTRSVTLSGQIGSFAVGESIQLLSGSTIVGYGTFFGQAGGDNAFVFDVVSGVLGTSILGTISGATGTIDAILFSETPIAEVGTAEWQVLDWTLDWGATATNPDSPIGGELPVLDELGAEREINRASGEEDPHYALRVSQVVDTVSPNAIRRAINRALVPLGITGCFREVGSSGLPGLFYDAGSSMDTVQHPDRNFAYDMDFSARGGADRYKVWLDVESFRGFFIVTVPSRTDGDFGYFYDAGTGAFPQLQNAYDLTGDGPAFDGFAATPPGWWRTLYAAISTAKAGGVGFLLVEDNGACP